MTLNIEATTPAAITDVAGSAASKIERPWIKTTPLDVHHLVSDNWQILLIEGHVALETAAHEFMLETGPDNEYPAPTHGWMRYVPVPEGECADWWREQCREGDKGAEPVTLSVLPW